MDVKVELREWGENKVLREKAKKGQESRYWNLNIYLILKFYRKAINWRKLYILLSQKETNETAEKIVTWDDL